MMHCEGKCYLNKKLKQQEKQDAPLNKVEQFNVIPFFVPKPLVFVSIKNADPLQFFIRNDDSITSFPRSIFHPPLG